MLKQRPCFTPSPWQLYQSAFCQMPDRCKALVAKRQRTFRFKNKLLILGATVIDLSATVYDLSACYGQAG